MLQNNARQQSSKSKLLPPKSKSDFRRRYSADSITDPDARPNNLPALRRSKTDDSLDDSYQLYDSGQKFNLFTEASCRIHLLPDLHHMKPWEKLIYHLRSTRSWESHHITLDQHNIASNEYYGVLDQAIPYKSIERVMPLDSEHAHYQYHHHQKSSNRLTNCVKIITTSSTYLFQLSNSHLRDKLIHSIRWKISVENFMERISNVNNATVLLHDLQSFVTKSINCPLYIDDTYNTILNCVSILLTKRANVVGDMPEAFITTLSPLVDRKPPTIEICNFFTKHCHSCPRSLLVVDMFSPIIHRILKHAVGFGKCNWLRTFVIEYLQALYSQSNGHQAVTNFVQRMHGPMSDCPHPRILQNLVAVCISGIHHAFPSPPPKPDLGKRKSKSLNENRKSTVYGSKDAASFEKNIIHWNEEAKKIKNVNFRHFDSDINSSIEDKHRNNNPSATADADENSLKLFAHVFHQIAKISDWAPGLACLLQPLPFPQRAVKGVKFLKLFYPVIEALCVDGRQQVLKCFLPIREGKKCWLDVFSPSCSMCDDEGRLFVNMVDVLSRPETQTGKLKKFLTILSQSQLEAIITLALREEHVMIKILSWMLRYNILQEQQQLQAISALTCTPPGRVSYEQLLQLQDIITKKQGPAHFALSRNSNDGDLQTLLGEGSWGNLERLDLSHTKITSKSVKVLKRLPSLKHLNLRNTLIGDTGLKMLCDYANLETLDLCETNVTDSGISCLEAMDNLTSLNLNSTSLSESQYYHLRESLPRLTHCDVTYTDAWAADSQQQNSSSVYL